MLFTNNTHDETEEPFCSYLSIKKNSNIISLLGTIVAILSVIAAIVIACISFKELWYVSLILIFFGVINCILFVILSNIIYGFGDLIEYTKEISENISKNSKK